MPLAQNPRVITRSIKGCSVAPSTKTASIALQSHCNDKRLSITHQPLSALKSAPRKIRSRRKGQAEALVTNIKRFGCVIPVLVTETGEVIDGHAVVEACKTLRHETIPTVIVDHLTPTETKTLRISLNKLSEGSVWDVDALAADFSELFSIDPSLLHFTAFPMPEIDSILSKLANDPDGDGDAQPGTGPTVSRSGDLWSFEGGHKLLCGSAREKASYEALLGTGEVQMVLTDPPYGCAIKGHVSRTHGDFVEGAGLNEGEISAFFEDFLSAMVGYLADGAIADFFIDGRGMFPLLQAIRAAGLEQKAVVVWDKGIGGMGSLYRQQVEFIVVTKSGNASHINNVDLGRWGRNRTTLWSAPGMAQFGKGRKEALQLHPTVKPVSLLMDALLDTSNRGGVVLDPFAGSGTLLAAAHRTQRLGRAIELDPKFVDVAIARMEKLTGKPARHASSNLTFAELSEQRLAQRDQTGSVGPVAVTSMGR
jgi:DNA modification methylase